MKNIVIKGWMVAAAIFVVMFGGILLTIGIVLTLFCTLIVLPAFAVKKTSI